MDRATESARAFAALVSGPPPALRLDRACALLSEAFTGRGCVDEVEQRLDLLAATVEQRLDPPAATVEQRLDLPAATVGARGFEGVLATLSASFTGNRQHYADPRNSYIDEVLRRGMGLPITLSVVAIEVGRRVGVDIVGVGLPGHFIVRDGGRDVYGDLFHGGRLLDRSEVVAFWRTMFRDGRPFDELHLAPVNERMILVRMLNNLRSAVESGDDARALFRLAVMRGAFAELADEAPQHARWVRAWN